MRRIQLAVLVAVALVLGAPAIAQALPPYTPADSVKVDTPTTTPGGQVRLVATGFTGGETVVIAVSSTAAAAGVAAPRAVAAAGQTTTADPTGRIDVLVPVGNAIGTVTITATGLTSNVQAVTTVQVVQSLPISVPEAGGTPAGGMPVTGTNGRLLLWQVLLAVAAIGLGAGLLVVTTRRRKPRETE
jgi:hypothetical protein